MKKKEKIIWNEPFQGEIKSLCLVTNTKYWYSEAVPGQEVEQKLMIDRKGHVRLKGYDYVPEDETHLAAYRNQALRNERRLGSQTDAKKLLNAVAIAFDKENCPEPVLYWSPGDERGWRLDITNTKGEIYRINGEFDTDFESGKQILSLLSAQMRGILGVDDLYGFDGNNRLRDVRKITVERCRQGGIKVTVAGKGVKPHTDAEQWMNREKLVVNLDKKMIKISRMTYPWGKQSRKYDCSEIAENFAEDFYGKFATADLFSAMSDVTYGRKRDYKITIDYRAGASRVIEGRFDKEGLPQDFGIFAEFVGKMIHGFPDSWEIWNPDFYDRPRYGEGEYIFCSVIFDEGGQKYYYLTEDKTIEEGDVVFVPVGPENHVIPGVVTDIEYFTGEDAPYPLEKVKNIIRKATEAEMKIDMDEIDAYLNPEDGDISIGQKLLMKRREKRGVRRTFFTQ